MWWRQTGEEEGEKKDQGVELKGEESQREEMQIGKLEVKVDMEVGSKGK